MLKLVLWKGASPMIRNLSKQTLNQLEMVAGYTETGWGQ